VGKRILLPKHDRLEIAARRSGLRVSESAWSVGLRVSRDESAGGTGGRETNTVTQTARYGVSFWASPTAPQRRGWDSPTALGLDFAWHPKKASRNPASTQWTKSSLHAVDEIQPARSGRRGWDSNPRNCEVHWFSKPARSATLAPLPIRCRIISIPHESARKIESTVQPMSLIAGTC
jgi:hypothetical protein